MSIRSEIAETLEEALFLEPNVFDGAILGLATWFGGGAAVAYDRAEVIEILMADGMSWEEAEEWFCFNTIGSYVGDHTPIYIELHKPRGDDAKA